MIPWIDYFDEVMADKEPAKYEGNRWLPMLVNWDMIISNIDLCHHDKSLAPNKYLPGTAITHGIVEPSMSRCYYEYLDILHDKFDMGFGSSAHVYTSFFSGATSLGMHKDTADVFILALKGSTTYHIQNHGSITINIGDVAYIPAGMLHEPESITPRSVISFGIEMMYRDKL